jgi:integrase
MAKRRGLSDKQIADLPRSDKRRVMPDPEQRGLYLRIPPEGPITFAAVARAPGGKQIWTTIGTTHEIDVATARAEAGEAIANVKAGKPAVELPKQAPDTVASVCENWLRREVDGKHREAYETRRIVGKYIVAHFEDRALRDVKRSEIAHWLDLLQDRHGARTCDRALYTFQAIANWFAKRDDTFMSPFVRGMNRDKSTGRDRILTDAEIKALWKAEGAAADCLRFLLLTGQRRAKALTMRWGDIQGDTWTIATEPGEKGNAASLKLPPAALALVNKQLRMNSDPRVFPFGEFKLIRDPAVFGRGWTPHDLRRTARSLMSRAGVTSEHAERVLGHVIPGVEGIYNRHAYESEKADALAKLSGLIAMICR